MNWEIMAGVWTLTFLLFCYLVYSFLSQIKREVVGIRLRLDGQDVGSQTALQNVLSALPDDFVGTLPFRSRSAQDHQDEFGYSSFSYFGYDEPPDPDELSPDAPDVSDNTR